jgi:exodeoxyribonuclease VII large subunit
VRAASGRVDALAARAAHRPLPALDRAAVALDQRAARAAAADPARLLARGWSITRAADGRLVRSVGDAPAGEVLTSTVADGDVRSRVEP